ncbi:MAG: 2,3,4,5-tetrahydropyridine-2,6-dicarboxylate N-succinyltransferase [Gemmatimonadetes bacterium]|nr:2,3,4,5-tetrahydropyridine-2,6-dicarboxylate N-succinyltransferase [Gemmatimonadota bacterium]
MVMKPTDIRSEIESAFGDGGDPSRHRELFSAFLALLNCGEVRAAEPDPKASHGWRVNRWVKRGILLGFRLGKVEETAIDGLFRFSDNDTYPPKRAPLTGGVRVVPGGSAIREGAFIGERVTCMPPMYVNVGAWVGNDTMIDSHALVGSCAQIGERCHVSAAAQIGGVLEPVGALPVIVEDDVLIGGNCGVYEGTVIKRRAVIGAGVVLTRSTPVYDVARGEVLRSDPLVIPEGAVVVPGSRPISKGIGREWGLHLQTPVIVKYRDEGTDSSTRLEELLR